MSITLGPHSLSAAVLSPTSVRLTWVTPCHTQRYHIYYRGTCGSYVDESRLDTDYQENTLNGLQEGMDYTFTVNQSGFSGDRVLSTGPVYAKTFTAGIIYLFTTEASCFIANKLTAFCTYSVPSGTPQSLEGMFVHLTEVLLKWRELTCIQQNGLITGYTVWYYANCGVDRNMQKKKSVVNTTMINGLTPNFDYVFRVAAVNVNGTGPFSEPITLRGKP